MDLDDRRVAAVFGDDWIVNDGGVTTIVVDGVTLHDANGATGRVVPNGARDVTIQAEGVTVDRSTGVLVVSQRAGNTILGRSFSVEDFIEGYAPRSAVYEGLPGFLLRLNGRGPAGERLRSPDSPVWVRLSGGGGTHDSDRSTAGAAYDFERLAAEAGADIFLGGNLTGTVSVRHVQASAEVSSPTGGGDIDAKGFGAGLGVSWGGASGWYVDGRLSVTGYKLDISTDRRGRLMGDVERGRSLPEPGDGSAHRPRREHDADASGVGEPLRDFHGQVHGRGELAGQAHRGEATQGRRRFGGGDRSRLGRRGVLPSGFGGRGADAQGRGNGR